MQLTQTIWRRWERIIVVPTEIQFSGGYSVVFLYDLGNVDLFKSKNYGAVSILTLSGCFNLRGFLMVLGSVDKRILDSLLDLKKDVRGVGGLNFVFRIWAISMNLVLGLTEMNSDSYAVIVRGFCAVEKQIENQFFVTGKGVILRIKVDVVKNKRGML